MLNPAFKKIAIPLQGSADSSFSLFSGRGSLRDSKIAQSVAQGTQQKDEKRCKSSPRSSLSAPQKASKSLQNAVLDLPMASRL